MATTPEQEALKAGANSLKEISKSSGPWAVLFIIVIVVATLYIYSEKSDCAQELKEIRKESAQELKEVRDDLQESRQALGKIEVELANCKATMSATTITNSNTTAKNRKR